MGRKRERVGEMPDKKMLLTQNLIFNLPTCVVMTLTGALTGGAGINPGTLIQFFIGLAVIELLGAVIPVQKIAQGIGGKFFPGKNPMQLPQLMLPAAVLTVVFTVPMTLVMTAVGLKMGGVPMSAYWPAFFAALPKMLLAAYISVLIFLPLSMKLSGLDKVGGHPER